MVSGQDRNTKCFTAHGELAWNPWVRSSDEVKSAQGSYPGRPNAHAIQLALQETDVEGGVMRYEDMSSYEVRESWEQRAEVGCVDNINIGNSVDFCRCY